MKKLTTRIIVIFKIILIFGISLAKAANVDYGSIAGQWKVQYGIEQELADIQVGTRSTVAVPLIISNIETASVDTNLYFEIYIKDEKNAYAEKRINIAEINESTATWQGEVLLEGKYFGYTNLYVRLNDPETNRVEINPQNLAVIVVRDKRIDDLAFTTTAGVIMLLMFLNLGTILDLKRVRSIFVRPIGPLVGFCARFLLMPALAIGLGMLLFKNNTNLQLALFFSALAPSGGIANICNIFLKGNIHLSLATTSVNSLLSLGMLPLWILLMKPILFNGSNLTLPWVELIIGCVGVLFAMFLGVMLRVCIPKTTILIFRFLKPLSVFLSLCLVAVTVGINAFVFKEITVWIFLAALCLPLIGYGLTFVLSLILRRNSTDAMTLAIESSVLNMSLPIVLIQYSLVQPLADMIVVVPVISALVSLCLVVIFYVIRRIFGYNTKRSEDAFDEAAYLVKE